MLKIPSSLGDITIAGVTRSAVNSDGTSAAKESTHWVVYLRPLPKFKL